MNTNDARFIVTMGPAEWLNRNNVAFGEVIVGLDVLKRIEKLGFHLHYL
jgi:peptidylprolyl isomerase